MHLFSFRNNPVRRVPKSFVTSKMTFGACDGLMGLQMITALFFVAHMTRVCVRITMAKPLIETEIPK